MHFLNKKTTKSINITQIDPDSLKIWLKKQDKMTQSWVKSHSYTGAAKSILKIPNKTGAITEILYGVEDNDDLYAYAPLAAQLPAHTAGYYISQKMNAEEAQNAALGWALGCYEFNLYKTGKKKEYAKLVLPENVDKKLLHATLDAVFLVRDLVNIPANDMGPEELANAAKTVAKNFTKATVKVIKGEALLEKNFPAIYEVGKASPRAPRLIDLQWGNKKHPLVTLVGKGVCFDTGGLNLKPTGSMLTMKKDMGGAAHVLGLAHMIMTQNLPIRLRVLIAAVENSVNGDAYRPGDIIETRKGLSVEIGNTDAEGRIVLSDALTEASREKPDLIIDFATLTGAARVALGPDLPAMFSNDDKIANALLAAGIETKDPVWRLPLWQPYKKDLASSCADTNNVGGQAGAITAALFLEKFVDENTPWVHIDTFAWNPNSKPGKPKGGEALGMRATYKMLENTFKKKTKKGK